AAAGLVDGFRARSGEKTLLDRLDDLRGRLIWSVVALIVTTGIGFYMAAWPIRFMVPERTIRLGSLGAFDFGGWQVDLDVLHFFVAPMDPFLGGSRLKY